MQEAETRYRPIEKLAFAVLIAYIKALKAIFSSAHTIEIPTNAPLLQILHKSTVTGRLTKWVIELTEFDIEFVPAKTIKA